MAPVNFDLVQELEAANAAAQAAIQDSPVGGGAGAQAVGTGAGAQLAGAAGVGAQADGAGAGAQPRGAMRWNNAMSSFVLCCMCQLISTGVRTDKGFKEVHLNQVAKAVQEFSGNKVTGNQVYNHLRKWRQRWIRVVKLRELSGALWDEENFMITLEDEHYAGHIKAHPKDAELLNKPIENYKQMEIIFGNGLATGKFAMGSGEALGSPSDFADSSVDGRVDEGGMIASEATKPLDVGAGSVSDEGRKRKRCMLSDGDIAVLDGMCDAVNNVADAIRETKVEEVPNGLYDAVMNMAGFTEEALMAAYSHLLDNKAHGVAFVGMTTSHRVLWLRTFLGKHY